MILYKDSLHGGESGIYATTGEAAIRLFTLILRICRFSGGSKLHRSPQCSSPIIGWRCKDKTFFWKLQHCELNFLFYLILISLSGTKVKKRNELTLVRFSPNLVLFSPNTFFVDEMGDFGTVRFEPIFLFQGKTILQLRNYLKSSSAVTADLRISEWAFRSIWACSIHPRQFIDE